MARKARELTGEESAQALSTAPLYAEIVYPRSGTLDGLAMFGLKWKTLNTEAKGILK